MTHSFDRTGRDPKVWWGCVTAEPSCLILCLFFINYRIIPAHQLLFIFRNVAHFRILGATTAAALCCSHSAATASGAAAAVGAS